MHQKIPFGSVIQWVDSWSDSDKLVLVGGTHSIYGIWRVSKILQFVCNLLVDLCENKYIVTHKWQLNHTQSSSHLPHAYLWGRLCKTACSLSVSLCSATFHSPHWECTKNLIFCGQLIWESASMENGMIIPIGGLEMLPWVPPICFMHPRKGTNQISSNGCLSL